eukprot:5849327-Pleurochrysis_carterae.AAC.3
MVMGQLHVLVRILVLSQLLSLPLPQHPIPRLVLGLACVSYSASLLSLPFSFHLPHQPLSLGILYFEEYCASSGPSSRIRQNELRQCARCATAS